MKTTNHYHLKNLLLLCTLMLSYFGSAQVDGASFTYTIANATNPTPTTLEFDVNLVVNHTSTALSDGGIKISQIQFGINFNKDILNGGTPSTTQNQSFTILAGTQ
ncbi:hypothetical protein [Flavobacterium sp. 3HN19-14]|uniref:hypothetical protein n=1 Tax=Flavobacterium sp. 3HN19-14 TaxID=3448133 RepID=UPI003EE2F8BD